MPIPSDNYFHPALNIDKAFIHAPCTLDESILPPLEEEGVLQLLAVICKIETATLRRHCRDTYNQKNALINTLRLICFRLNKDLDEILGRISDSEKTVIIDGILENIHQCTPGFHTRMNYLLQIFLQPKTLLEYLTQLRTNCVHAVAYEICRHNTNAIMEIHLFNEVVNLAYLNGLGINAILTTDPNRYNLPSDTPERLQRKLISTLHPITLPLTLSELLKERLTYMGYHDPCFDAQHYSQNCKEFLEAIFQATGRKETIDFTEDTSFLEDYFVINHVYEGITYPDVQFIRDIKWQTVHRYFFSALCDARIIHKKVLASKNFFDWVALAYYCPDLPLPSPDKLNQWLIELKSNKKRLETMEDFFPQKSAVFFLANVLMERIGQYDPVHLLHLLMLPGKNRKTMLHQLFASYPEFSHYFLRFLHQNPHIFTPDFFKVLLLNKDPNGHYLLTSVIRYYPALLPTLSLVILKQQSQLGSVVMDTLLSFRDEQNNSLLQIIVSCHCSYATELLALFHKSQVFLSALRWKCLIFNANASDQTLLDVQNVPQDFYQTLFEYFYQYSNKKGTLSSLIDKYFTNKDQPIPKPILFALLAVEKQCIAKDVFDYHPKNNQILTSITDKLFLKIIFRHYPQWLFDKATSTNLLSYLIAVANFLHTATENWQKADISEVAKYMPGIEAIFFRKWWQVISSLIESPSVKELSQSLSKNHLCEIGQNYLFQQQYRHSSGIKKNVMPQIGKDGRFQVRQFAKNPQFWLSFSSNEWHLHDLSPPVIEGLIRFFLNANKKQREAVLEKHGKLIHAIYPNMYQYPIPWKIINEFSRLCFALKSSIAPSSFFEALSLWCNCVQYRTEVLPQFLELWRNFYETLEPNQIQAMMLKTLTIENLPISSIISLLNFWAWYLEKKGVLIYLSPYDPAQHVYQSTATIFCNMLRKRTPAASVLMNFLESNFKHLDNDFYEKVLEAALSDDFREKFFNSGYDVRFMQLYLLQHPMQEYTLLKTVIGNELSFYYSYNLPRLSLLKALFKLNSEKRTALLAAKDKNRNLPLLGQLIFSTNNDEAQRKLLLKLIHTLPKHCFSTILTSIQEQMQQRKEFIEILYFLRFLCQHDAKSHITYIKSLYALLVECDNGYYDGFLANNHSLKHLPGLSDLKSELWDSAQSDNHYLPLCIHIQLHFSSAPISEEMLKKMFRPLLLQQLSAIRESEQNFRIHPNLLWPIKTQQVKLGTDVQQTIYEYLMFAFATQTNWSPILDSVVENNRNLLLSFAEKLKMFSSHSEKYRNLVLALLKAQQRYLEERVKNGNAYLHFYSIFTGYSAGDELEAVNELISAISPRRRFKSIYEKKPPALQSGQLKILLSLCKEITNNCQHNALSHHKYRREPMLLF